MATSAPDRRARLRSLLLVQTDPTLSRHFRTITFDIRGEHNFARSVVDLATKMIALLDHLGVEKTHVLRT